MEGVHVLLSNLANRSPNSRINIRARANSSMMDWYLSICLIPSFLTELCSIALNTSRSSGVSVSNIVSPKIVDKYRKGYLRHKNSKVSYMCH